MQTLLTKIDEYKALLDRKDELKELTSENNEALDKCKKELSDLMIAEETTQVTRNGFSYSLALKTFYSKKSEAFFHEKGIDFFDVLRENGLGDLIKETVNSRSLQSTIADIVEENGEMPESLSECISSYEQYDITKRRAAK